MGGSRMQAGLSYMTKYPKRSAVKKTCGYKQKNPLHLAGDLRDQLKSVLRNLPSRSLTF